MAILLGLDLVPKGSCTKYYIRTELVGFLIKRILDAWFSVFPFNDEFVLVLQELGELSEHVGGQRSEAHFLCDIDGEAL